MNEQTLVRQFLKAVFHELYRSKNAYNILASAALLASMAVGFFWSEKFVSETTIAARLKTSVEPKDRLVQQQADIRRLAGQFDSRPFVEQANERLRSALTSASSQNFSDIPNVEKDVEIRVDENNLLTLCFSSASPRKAHEGLTALTALMLNFVQPTGKLKSLDEAYQRSLLDETQLRAQLNDMEARIDELRVQPGAAEGNQSARRVARISDSVQDVDVNISTSEAKIAGIKAQLDREEKLQANRQLLRELKQQREKVLASLEEEQRTYLPGAPELVSLQKELDNVNIEIQQRSRGDTVYGESDNVGESLYAQLRKQLSLEEVERDALYSRRDSLRALLKVERSKVNLGQAESIELEKLRKNVALTEEKYRDVLKKSERIFSNKKRLEESMPDYWLQGQPTVPETYSGLGFVEFLIMGPIIAFGLPLFLASAIVLFDSQIRTSRQLRRSVPGNVSVLGAIPHYNSPRTSRIFRNAVFGVVAWTGFVFTVYITVGVIGLKG